MQCDQCGTGVNSDAKFCQKCGASVGTAKQSAPIEGQTSSLPGGKSTPDSPLVGVKGWLLVFCVLLTIVVPLLALWNLVSEWAVVAHIAEGPYADYLSTIRLIVVLNEMVAIPLAAFGVYAGIALWSVKPNAVRIAKIGLVASLAYNLLWPLVLEAVSDLPREIHNAMISELANGARNALISFAIWFTYLYRSKRVRATYFPSMAERDESRAPSDRDLT